MLKKHKHQKPELITLQFSKENFIIFMSLLKDDGVLNTTKQKNLKAQLRAIYNSNILGEV